MGQDASWEQNLPSHPGRRRPIPPLHPQPLPSLTPNGERWGCGAPRSILVVISNPVVMPQAGCAYTKLYTQHRSLTVNWGPLRTGFSPGLPLHAGLVSYRLKPFPSGMRWPFLLANPPVALTPALVLLSKAHKLMVKMTCYTYGHVFSDRKGHYVSYTEINNPSMLEWLWSTASRLVMFSGRKRVLCFPHRKQGEPSLLQYFKTEQAVTQRSEQPGCPRSPARLTTGLFSPFQHLKNIVPHFYFSKTM